MKRRDIDNRVDADNKSSQAHAPNNSASLRQRHIWTDRGQPQQSEHRGAETTGRIDRKERIERTEKVENRLKHFFHRASLAMPARPVAQKWGKLAGFQAL